MWIYDQPIMGIAALAILLLLWGVKKSYDRFAEEVGKQTAELIAIKQKTIEVEAVKRIFNEKLELFKNDIQLNFVREVEPLKASLSKENIAYQIYTTEYIKMRFERLDELYARLYTLEKNFCEVYDYSKEFYQKELSERHHILYRDFYNPAEDALAKAFIYMEDATIDSVRSFLNESKKGFSLAARWYTTRHISYQHKTEVQIEKFIELDEQCSKTIEKVNSLLKEVEVKFKRNLIVA